VFCQTLSPYQELDLYRSWEREFEKRVELHRLLLAGAPERLGLLGQTMLIAGDALVAVGEWLRSRSCRAISTAGYASPLR
jgi:hypothetical protein